MKLSKIVVNGEGNSLIIENGTKLKKTKIFIQGDNIKVFIGKRNSLFHSNIFVQDDNCTLIIGDGNGFGKNMHIAVTEGKMIKIGNNNLLAQNVTFRNGDSHAIYDVESESRVNEAQDVIIGDHNWFGYNTTILKGVEIFNDTIVATGAIVTKSPKLKNCILAGCPAKVAKQNVYWTLNR